MTTTIITMVLVDTGRSPFVVHDEHSPVVNVARIPPVVCHHSARRTTSLVINRNRER